MVNSPNPLILLASASPRRSALLNQIGVPHAIRPVDIDETVRAGESPSEYVHRLAKSKAETLWDRLSPSDQLPVLGADTTVALGSDILGKPANSAELLTMLRRLGGQTHQVHTGVALRSKRGTELRLSVSDVTFRPLTDIEIVAYWETGEPADKAGGYAIQGRAALFVQRIHGSYTGIVGLPLFETGELLSSLGWKGLELRGSDARSGGGAR